MVNDNGLSEKMAESKVLLTELNELAADLDTKVEELNRLVGNAKADLNTKIKDIILKHQSAI
jgi:uncharacterized protein YoxC